MTIEKDFFRQVMGQFATGVTVVTTATSEGLSGLTVNSFASVSLEPPLVLICIDLHSQTLPFLRASGYFAVNFLTNEQENLSRCFAITSVERHQHFCHAPYQVAATGSPILDGVLAFVDAHIVAEYPGGDHAIFLGEVEAMGTDGKAQFLHAAGQARSTLTEWSAGESDDTRELQQHTNVPLAYYRGQYRHLARDYQRPSLAGYYDEDFE
ncbi:MAG TPA: flavin reductase family protein [Ktedonobacteraceae bacterium]|nr:flavin reductase family protein [Ktedonobacteraceae bacterium]